MGKQTPGVYSAAEDLRRGDAAAVRAALRDARARTLAWAEAYADALGPALAVPRDDHLNPPLWELGHVAWFQEWWIARNPQRARGAQAEPDAPRAPPLWPQADAWYDSSRVPHAMRWSLPLPSLAATRELLEATLERSLALLDDLPPDAGDAALYFFRLAALHEAMHAEAAGYMARRLGFALAVPGAPAAARERSGVLHLRAQDFLLGSAEPGFAFDNEQPAQHVQLPAFEIDAAPVSWGRYAAFVEDGGYREPCWWDAPGWAWRQRHRPSQPAFASQAADQPAVHLSAHEAQAWCRWAGRRLPTEAEWECAALAAPGFAFGQVWEWTASEFTPYPGFRAHPYRDYSAPWFGTGLRVLRGACVATSPWLAHPRYRNFFAPGRSDVFAGFRSCGVA